MPKFSLLTWASILGSVLFVTGFAWAAIWYHYARDRMNEQLLYEARPPQAAGFLVTISFLILLPCLIVKVNKFIAVRKHAKK
jgi:hypothetical protein